MKMRSISLICILMLIVLVCSCSSDKDRLSAQNRTSNEAVNTINADADNAVNKIELLQHNTQESHKSAVDCDRDFSRLMSNMAVSDEALYFADMNTSPLKRLIFIDRESGLSGPLCGKPECLHDSQDCNSFLANERVLGLSYYDGKLYWLGAYTNVKGMEDGYHIFSIEPDGTKRELVRTISKRFDDVPGGNTEVFFHRGYMFLCGEGSSEVIKDGYPVNMVQIFAYSLKDPDNDILIENTEPAEDGLSVRIQPYGDYLYYMLSSAAENEEGRLVDRYLTIIRYNIQDRTKKVLCELDNTVPSGLCSQDLWVTNNNVLISSDDGRIYECIEENGTIRIRPGFESHTQEEYNIFSHDRVFSLQGDYLKSYDFSGKQLSETAFSIFPYEAIITPLGADGKVFYYWKSSLDHLRRSLVGVPIAGGDAVELWDSDD